MVRDQGTEDGGQDCSKMRLICLLSSIFCLLVSGCASSTRPAPVVDRAPAASAKKTVVRHVKTPDMRPQTYTVQKGDTLYGIALEHGYDYKEIAEWNGIEPPYTIKVGQTLKLTQAAASSQAGQVEVTPLKTVAAPGDAMLKTEPKAFKQPYSEQALAKPALVPTPPSVVPPVIAVKPAEEKKDAAAEDDDKLDWGWPTQGKVVGEFNDSSSTKGVDIAGKTGQSVNAAAAGKVVYSGSGLRGYGKLIIIKHNKTYLSAYAHNSQVLVKEGQSVTKGQKIAEMGDSDADRVKLHFEIRRFGKPVDPMKYLSADGSA
jgi:lipoprotein NlpD